MRRFSEEHDLSLSDLKTIIFDRGRKELEAYTNAKERGYSDYDVENQRLRYIAIWVVIEEAGLEEEFGLWKMQK